MKAKVNIRQKRFFPNVEGNNSFSRLVSFAASSNNGDSQQTRYFKPANP
jgi:hypothetical protein